MALPPKPILVHNLKRGDNAPALRYPYPDDPAPIGATATFSMARRGGEGLSVTAAPARIDPDGFLVYDWNASDTSTPGIYEAEFTVDLPGGLSRTIPAEAFIAVIVGESLRPPQRDTLTLITRASIIRAGTIITEAA